MVMALLNRAQVNRRKGLAAAMISALVAEPTNPYSTDADARVALDGPTVDKQKYFIAWRPTTAEAEALCDDNEDGKVLLTEHGSMIVPLARVPANIAQRLGGFASWHQLSTSPPVVYVDEIITLIRKQGFFPQLMSHLTAGGGGDLPIAGVELAVSSSRADWAVRLRRLYGEAGFDKEKSCEAHRLYGHVKGAVYMCRQPPRHM